MRATWGPALRDTPQSEHGEGLELRVPVASTLRLETPTHTVTISHEAGAAGHGISWHDSAIEARWKDETGSSRFLEASAAHDGGAILFTQIPLSGAFRHRTADGLELTRANTGLTRLDNLWGLYDLNMGEDFHLFGINAPVDAVGHWFGDRVPEPLRPFLAAAPPPSLHRPTGIPLPLIHALTLARSYGSPMRRFAIEAASLQILTHVLQNVCDGAGTEPGLTAREVRAARAAQEMIRLRLESPPLAGELAARFGLSVRRLELAFRTVFGMSLHAAAVQARFDAAADALRDGVPVKTVAHRLGYATVSNFTSAFRRRFGIPPGKFGKG